MRKGEQNDKNCPLGNLPLRNSDNANESFRKALPQHVTDFVISRAKESIISLCTNY